MENEALQKENEKLRLQRGYLIAFIAVLFMTFVAIEYVTLKESKNAITQLETTVQGLVKTIDNERKITAQNP